MRSRQFTLASRPTDRPALENFELVEVELPDPGPGQVLIQNSHLSVDPYMRGLILQGRTAHVPYNLGEAMWGGAVGTVLASGSERFAPGDAVHHLGGWRDVALVEEAQVNVIDVERIPASAYLGVLGLTGFTAWVGVRLFGKVAEGDVVFVSAAAGGVGSVAGQLARRYGASRVVGSAGSAEKVRYVIEELGFDAAFDYHDGPLAERLEAAAPDGIDVYFDNVGGEHLEAAIGAMRPHGRIALCGAIAYPSIWHEAPGPRNLAMAIPKRLSLHGYVTTDHEAERPAFEADVKAGIIDGSILVRETIAHGLEQAPEAFLGMLKGENLGKMIIEL